MISQPLADLYRIHNFNDTFALGHYARVMDATDRRTGETIAFKVLRPEHLNPSDDIRWEAWAFPNEAALLMSLADSPYVIRLMDCGFVSGDGEAPMMGEAVSFGQDVHSFESELPSFIQKKWRPYLALENLPRTKNLLYLMKPNAGGIRRRLPSEEGLALALQFADLLRTAHRLGIVYLDHKLEHVYWDGLRLQIIDFNSSQFIDQTAADASSRYRTDIHNLCVGVLYPIFTGLSPQQSTLRPQPGDMSEVESRYNDVQALDFGVEPTLSSSLTALMQRGAAIQIPSADTLLEELRKIAAEHGWDFPEAYTSPVSRDARSQMKEGITRLREGQQCLREARDLFREAAVQEDIAEDLEAELRRLVKSVNIALNYRVIP